MRKIREVLRLRFELRLGQRAIARACSISQSTVHEYLNRAAAAGVVWPLGEEWDEQRVEQALFGERQVVKRLPGQVLPDFPALHSQLQQHRHLTLQLAWEEYRQIHPEVYGYNRLCELYQRWLRKQDVVLRQVHKPGEKGFVDWAGATIPVHDPLTGEAWPASLFVMVLGTSSYTYAEATRDQQLSAWISAQLLVPGGFGISVGTRAQHHHEQRGWPGFAGKRIVYRNRGTGPVDEALLARLVYREELHPA